MSGRPGRFAAGSDHGRRRFHLPPVRAYLSVRRPSRGQARPVQDVPGRLPDPRVRAGRADQARARDGHDIDGAPVVLAAFPAGATRPGGEDRLQLPDLRARLSSRGEAGRETGTLHHLPRRLHDPRSISPRDRKPGRRRRSGARPRPIARPDRSRRTRARPGGRGGRIPRGPIRPPPGARSVGRPFLPVPAAGDSGWWELDSSESIPAATATVNAGRSRTAAATALPRRGMDRGRRRRRSGGDGHTRPPEMGAPLRRSPRASSSVAIAFAITYSLVFECVPAGIAGGASSRRTAPPPPTPPWWSPIPPVRVRVLRPARSPTRRPIGIARPSTRSSAPTTRSPTATPASATRARSPTGNAPISQGVAQLRSAARRGKDLPPLSPPERQALVRQTGPACSRPSTGCLGELSPAPGDARPAFRLRPA